MSLPPIPERTHWEGCETEHLECALVARIKALNQYARHQYPSCMADEEGVRCDCGLSGLLEQLEKEGLA